jgi:hypothetical protein
VRPGYPAGSRIVTAAWLEGMGLPDNGGANSNPGDPADNPSKKDPHTGLLLSKNGPTPDCSSAGAVIEGVKGMTVSPTFSLGFDYRNGGHRGAGAPRFDVVVKSSATSTETSHFVGGCANDGARPPLPRSRRSGRACGSRRATRRRRSRPAGSRVRSIAILYDEGTDAPTVQDPNGVGR